ncbi:hypothetical protein NDU88_006933 [Pleurodeles waltl]|uniref:Uncharacterized protein n=1 Tax=Pleurodeles waltl TaxID=8319 RepID=A0AAV7VST3_PLEWA|nr:hypothetical protein NDU88_006933 [Pleurodeles waltl]
MEGPGGHVGGTGRAKGGFSGQPPTGLGRGSPAGHSCTGRWFLSVLGAAGAVLGPGVGFFVTRQSRSGGAFGSSLQTSLWGCGVDSGYSRHRPGVLSVVLVLWSSSRGRRVQSEKSHASGRKREFFGSC